MSKSQEIKKVTIKVRHYLIVMSSTTDNGSSGILGKFYLEHKIETSDPKQIDDFKKSTVSSKIYLRPADVIGYGHVSSITKDGGNLEVIMVPCDPAVIFVDRTEEMLNPEILEKNASDIRGKINLAFLEKVRGFKKAGWTRCGETGLWREYIFYPIKIHETVEVAKTPDVEYIELEETFIPSGWKGNI